MTAPCEALGQRGTLRGWPLKRSAVVALASPGRGQVEAALAYRRADAGSEEAARAWRRLAILRERRRALMPSADAAHLLPLPPAPASSQPSAWQKLRRRLFGLW